MATKTLLREILQINKKSVYDDHRVEISFPKGEEDCFDILIAIEPTSGYYAGARIDFEMILPQDYPCSRPRLLCQTPGMYHPNIRAQSVCFSMVNEDWTKDYRIEHFINGILWLLNNPNPNSPLTHVSRNDIVFRNEIARAINFGRYATESFVFRNRIPPPPPQQWEQSGPLRNTPWIGFLRSNDMKPSWIQRKARDGTLLLTQALWIIRDRLVITLSRPAHFLMPQQVEAMTGHPIQKEPSRFEADKFIPGPYTWKSLPLTGYHPNGPIVYLFDEDHLTSMSSHFYVRSGTPHLYMKLSLSEIKSCIQDNQKNCGDLLFKRQWPTIDKEEVVEHDPNEEISVKLRIHYQTEFGKSIRMAHSSDRLYAAPWSPLSSPFLLYKDGFWSLNMILPRWVFPMEYKYVIHNDRTGEWEWETRKNRKLAIKEGTIIIKDDTWNH
eukprot:TRINITY_DN3119_c0_g1_i1.p1 TRINITY_DN3119_c0_g1~~TRINITY_DN3119_c0_g1_i1.p1  ORF type:complete len:439 (-),score=52.05 TRINITY_DN3119_c0_g1_i1:49-1365(-)